MSNTETTYIIGHKNPDTDAICSAITYADYKNRIDPQTSYTAARCGNTNPRIDAILEHFKTPAPLFLGDVTPRAEDILRTKVHHVPMGATCSAALSLIDEHDIRALPVLGDAGEVLGTVSIFQLGEHFAPRPNDPASMRRVHSSINDIITTLGAKALHTSDAEKVETLYLRIAAMSPETFTHFITRKGIQAENSIVIVGDRENIQKKCIELGVRLMVITGGLDIQPAILKAAKAARTSIISSPWDTAGTSWSIRTATHIENIMSKEFPSFNNHEKLSSIQRKISRIYTPLFCVMDERKKLLGVFSKSDLFATSKKKLILVDHNELSQAIDGANEAEIVEILDHHRLGNPPTAQPINMHNAVIGSTCSLVAEAFMQNKIELKPSMAGLMMAGLISDTLNLQSPTTTPKDAELLAWLSKKAKTPVEKLVELIFHSGSIILNTKPAELIEVDCKTYEQSNAKYSASQIEELGFANFNRHQDAIIDALEKYRESKQLDFSVLLVTDVNHQNSLLVVRGPEDLLESISYARNYHPNIFYLPEIVSRKKQLIPYLTNLLDQIDLNA